MGSYKVLLTTLAVFLGIASACARNKIDDSTSLIGITPTHTPILASTATVAFTGIPFTTPTYTVVPSSTSTPIPTTEVSIVGYWDCPNTDEAPPYYDFTRDGRVLVGNQGSIPFPYEVLSENSILIKTRSGQELLRVIELQSDRLTLQADSKIECVKQIGYLNLTNDIVGLWVSNDPNHNIEFAQNGTYIMSSGSNESATSAAGLGKYQVLSSNSILIQIDVPQKSDPVTMQVNGISSETLMVSYYQSPPFSLTKVKGTPNLVEKIVGVWRMGQGPAVEFTKAGKLLVYAHNSVSDYTVISDNSIVIESASAINPANRFSVMTFIDVSVDQLKFVMWGRVYDTPTILIREK